MDDTVKQGWLQKLSPNQTFGNKFQKRFFVLKCRYFVSSFLTHSRGVTLSYYKDVKDNRNKPAGTIDLANARAYSLTSEERYFIFLLDVDVFFRIVKCFSHHSMKKVNSPFGFEIKVDGIKKLTEKQMARSQRNDGKQAKDVRVYVFVGGSADDVRVESLINSPSCSSNSQSWCDAISKMKLNHLTRLARQKDAAERSFPSP